jgi:hypothetical protein
LLALAASLAFIRTTERLVHGFGVDVGVVVVRLRLRFGVGSERIFIRFRIVVLRVAKLFKLVRSLIILAFAAFCERDMESVREWP